MLYLCTLKACIRGSHSNKVTLAPLFTHILEKNHQINMNTKQITSSFIVRAALLLLTVFTTTGAWAQTSVLTEEKLNEAITRGDANIQLAGDIKLSNYLNINGITVTIDLNGHRLYRELSEHSSGGHVIYANGGCNLTLTSTAEGYGIIEGGKANNGGAINITHGNTVTATNVTFQNNSAADHGGAIWNNGTVTATNCTFENNTANDVGGIYNAVQTEGTNTYSGTATLTGCTFKGNKGTAGAGALANALGATVMTIDGCTIENNTADTYGAGIWNGGTLKMKGAIKVQDNTNAGGMLSNVYLKTGKVITVTGSLEGSKIGVDMESTSGVFTSGYNSFNSGVDPKTLFTADHFSFMVVIQNGGEAELTSWYPNPANIVTFIERSWDSANKKVVNTEKVLTSLIAYDETPDAEWQYKEVTSAPADEPNQWFGMGDSDTDIAEYYVVRGNVNRETIVVQGSNVHLVLCNGATLTLTGGLKLEGDNKLYIHSQSYGGAMGRLMVTNKYDDAAGIGSAWDNGVAKTVGELVIYGGRIEATGGEFAPGIGACSSGNHEKLCKKVTVYGGYVKATGGEHAAGIGGGYEGPGGDFVLYDGTVIAKGGIAVIIFSTDNYSIGIPAGGGAGVGGGGVTNWEEKYAGFGGNVTIYGGTLTATGSACAAGIGSGASLYNNKTDQLCGGTFTIYGGTVTALGDEGAAGIGGGAENSGAEVYVYGGTVKATGRGGAAGIGGGSQGHGRDVTITGGTVIAKGSGGGAGIGGGSQGNGGSMTITGGTVTATGIAGGAGIGGGYQGDGGDVTITGGTVIAKAGTQGGEQNRAIGPGNGNNKYGTLSVGDAMMVGAGNSGSVERIFDADERKNGCWYRTYAEISPCTHPSGLTYTINEDGTHTSHCKHCTVSETAGHSTGTCVCGYNDGSYTITIATSTNDTYYEGVGVVANVGNGKPYTLPVCSTFPDGYDFAGWAVGATSHNGILRNGDEPLKQAGEAITVTDNVSIFARYQALEISLADNGDNDEKLYTYNGRKAASVTLTGRKLWKDGDWNTLCLPFSLSAEQISASDLAGADIRTLNSTTFSNGTLTLDFTGVGEVTSITAGTPYIVKWSNTTPDYIENPEFTDVTIVKTTTNVETDFADFVGNYSPRVYTDTIRSVLFLGAGNTLYYPQPTITNPNADYDAETNPRVPVTIGACRAVFLLKNGLVCGEPAEPASGINNFVLNFGDDATGIVDADFKSASQESGISNPLQQTWYTLDGRKLNGKPARAGVYINNGRKVVIK